ncbi:hypothetical protein PMEGAPL125_05090 [Priestia megaterium]
MWICVTNRTTFRLNNLSSNGKVGSYDSFDTTALNGSKLIKEKSLLTTEELRITVYR